MAVNSLIDLFVPTLDAHDASVSVAMSGLDCGVLAFSDLSALEEFESSGPTPMHGGLQLVVEDTTILILLPTCKMADYAPLLDLDGLEAVMEAVRQENGCTIVAGGHMVGDDVRAPFPRSPGGLDGSFTWCGGRCSRETSLSKTLRSPGSGSSEGPAPRAAWRPSVAMQRCCPWNPVIDGP